MLKKISKLKQKINKIYSLWSIDGSSCGPNYGSETKRRNKFTHTKLGRRKCGWSVWSWDRYECLHRLVRKQSKENCTQHSDRLPWVMIKTHFQLSSMRKKSQINLQTCLWEAENKRPRNDIHNCLRNDLRHEVYPV